MSEYQPIPQVTPPAQSRTGLLIALIAIAVCLIVIAVVAAVAGLGWLIYDQAQTDDATGAAVIGEVDLPPGWSSSLTDRFVFNQNDWQVGSYEEDFGTAELAIDDGSYRWVVKSADVDGVFWWQVPDFDNDLGAFYLSVDGRHIDGDVYNANYGLIFRYADEDNYYFFGVSDSQGFYVELLKDNKWTVLVDWADTSLVHPGEANHLAVMAEGAHYRFYINGELAHELDDDQLSGGGVGLGVDVWDVEGITFDFDNFQVYEP